jgi:hypothetical protein
MVIKSTYETQGVSVISKISMIIAGSISIENIIAAQII